MRDAFGGAFMIRIFLIFIIIYVGFTAVALNYAKAFRAKNMVINYLEDNEITNIDDLTKKEFDNMLQYFETEIAGKLNYAHEIDCTGKTSCFRDIGINIETIAPYDSEKGRLGVYHKVTTYFGYEISFFRFLLAASGKNDNGRTFGEWKITGETRLIVKE